MSHIRTVLGDIDPDELGPTYAHEHLAIAPGRATDLSPDCLLDDADKAVAELAPAVELGLGAIVDAMPADCGRDAELLALISRRADVQVIAPTGLHHARFYPARHWSTRFSADALAALFVADIEDGIDRFDYGGPVVERTPHRAGIIKVGGSEEEPSARDVPIFEAAAMTHHRTGCPILTHCDAGTGAIEQVELLIGHGASAEHILLSHVDKVVDRGYHREIHATGALVEYDQGFRWGNGENGSLRLLEWAAEDDALDSITLGLDAARRSYWTEYGGGPGWTYLLGTFADAMRERGIDDDMQARLFVANPATVLAFTDTPG